MGWVDIAQIVTAVAAVVALGCTARQIGRARLTADLQALQKFADDVILRQAALGSASDDAAKICAFNEFLNFLELYACSYNEGHFIGKGSRRMVRHNLIDSVIELECSGRWHAQIEEALDRSTTFEELTKFMERHKAEKETRRAERAKRLSCGS